MRRAQERGREISEPVGVGVRIVIQIRHDLACGGGQARVSRAGQAPVRGADEADVVGARDRRRVVGRAVVHHDHFVVGVVEVPQPLTRVADRAPPVVGADHDRDTGPRQGGLERRLGERFPHGLERRLGRSVGPREAERPVLHVVPMAVPLVRPGEDEHPATSGRERRPDLPVE